jgi:hypothetical protein
MVILERLDLIDLIGIRIYDMNATGDTGIKRVYRSKDL